MDVDLLRFVVVGSVDDGKSTLIGRLLYEAQALHDDHLSQVKRASKQGGPIDFSLFTDGLKAEREQGITIDVAYRHFATARRRFIVADTPGHVQYTRNMATGASTADVGVILVDARLGVLPQTRRHASLAALLGIPHLAVVINKMDLAAFAEPIYRTFEKELIDFTAKLGFYRVTFFPVSATQGDNVVEKSARTPWFEGKPLLEFLETVEIARPQEAAPLRLPVQTVIRSGLDFRGFAGAIASGSLRVGQQVAVLPSGKKSKVTAIDAAGHQVMEATTPRSVTVQLADQVDVSRGDVLVPLESPTPLSRRLDAMLVWMDETPLDPSREYLVKHTTRTATGRIARVQWKTNHETLEQVPAERLELNDIGRVTLECPRGLLADRYAQNRATGAFIVIDPLSRATAAAGMVVELDAAPQGEQLRPITADEREARLGHRALALSVPPAIAPWLERELFDRGLNVVSVASLAAALACERAGLIALWPTPEPVPAIPAIDAKASRDEALGLVLKLLAAPRKA
ncbi:MAG: 50S ribosome-binding GTPase [Myxococcaceae bacterium]|nr:50S ribosome-binding GTPase [Myxococcaceae bacterium]